MFIHSRDCADETFRTLEKHRDHLASRGCVVHSFDGTPQEALRLVDNIPNLYIGLNGCSLRTNDNLETVKSLPLDRILIETDAPWCEIKRTHAGYPFLHPSSCSSSSSSSSSEVRGGEYLELDAKDFKRRLRETGSHSKEADDESSSSSTRKKREGEEFVVRSRNEPRNLIAVLEIVARVRNKESVEEVARVVLENTMRLFFPG